MRNLSNIDTALGLLRPDNDHATIWRRLDVTARILLTRFHHTGDRSDLGSAVAVVEMTQDQAGFTQNDEEGASVSNLF